MEKINLPITGICSFGSILSAQSWTALDADVAIVGVPYDLVLAICQHTFRTKAYQRSIGTVRAWPNRVLRP